MNTPNEIAEADQFQAATHEAVTQTVQAMKQMIAVHPPNPAIQLQTLRTALKALCDEDPDTIDKIIANYVTAIYELAQK